MITAATFTAWACMMLFPVVDGPHSLWETFWNKANGINDYSGDMGSGGGVFDNDPIEQRNNPSNHGGNESTIDRGTEKPARPGAPGERSSGGQGAIASRGSSSGQQKNIAVVLPSKPAAGTLVEANPSLQNQQQTTIASATRSSNGKGGSAMVQTSNATTTQPTSTASRVTPGGNPPALPPDDGDPVDVPLDGGASLFIAAGVGAGLIKAYRVRKQTKSKPLSGEGI
jgi:hypothetical protein